MSKIVAFRNESAFKNIEGDTYVIPGEDPYNPVEIKEKGKTDWNDLEAFNDEAEYISPNKVSKTSIDRIKAMRVDESILAAAA